jgi:hypothetical protein
MMWRGSKLILCKNLILNRRVGAILDYTGPTISPPPKGNPVCDTDLNYLSETFGLF